MSFNALLDIAIGLIFMYLLLSLVCTAVNEFLASLLKLRAANLRRGIDALIDDPELRRAFDQVPLLKTMARVSGGGGGSSYLAPRTFALGLTEAIGSQRKVADMASARELVAAIEGLPQSDLRDSLLALTRDAADDLEALRQRIAGWFDQSMDRAAGVYKRKMQYISLAIGLILAVAVNADSVQVARSLWSDALLRSQIAQSAAAWAESGEPRELADVLEEMRPLPIGWSFEAAKEDTPWYASGYTIFAKIFGLLLTGAAVSLGAPFWFDLLSKFTKVRGSGAKPEREAAA